MCNQVPPTFMAIDAPNCPTTTLCHPLAQHPAGTHVPPGQTTALLTGNVPPQEPEQLLSRRRYRALCLIVLALVASQCCSRRRAADFWEHAAAVDQLMRDLQPNQHPILADVTAPHPFMTPYHMLVALIARVCGVTSVIGLTCAGIACLLVFFAVFPRVVCALANEAVDPFFPMCCVLFLWGPAPWGYSGFLHIAGLGNVFTYPSFFAAILTFCVWILGARLSGSEGRLYEYVAFSIAAAGVVLCHPLTTVPMILVLAALRLRTWSRTLDARLVGLGFSCLGSVLLVLSWPYFSVPSLLRDGVCYHPSNMSMYRNTGMGLAICLLVGLPCLALRCRKWGLGDPLVVLFTGGGILYVAGYTSGAYSHGRIIAWIAFALQISAGLWLADGERRVGSPHELNDGMRQAFRCARTALYVLAGWLTITVYWYAPGRHGDCSGYPEMAAKVDRSLVVLADSSAARIAPAFGVRVVASPRKFPFVHDADERYQDMQSFFCSSTPLETRHRILRKYGVGLIMVSRSATSAYTETRSACAELADVVDENEHVALFKVRGTNFSATEAAADPD